MYLLDTDVLIDIQRGHAPAITWFSSLSDIPIAVRSRGEVWGLALCPCPMPAEAYALGPREHLMLRSKGYSVPGFVVMELIQDSQNMQQLRTSTSIGCTITKPDQEPL